MTLQELVRQVLSAIRAVAGNDDVKDTVVDSGGVQLIVIAMNRHMGNAAVSNMYNDITLHLSVYKKTKHYYSCLNLCST